MPVLIRIFAKRKNTFFWKCSECEDVFSLVSIFREPTPTELKEVKDTFREHCKVKHPRAA